MYRIRVCVCVYVITILNILYTVYLTHIYTPFYPTTCQNHNCFCCVAEISHLRARQPQATLRTGTSEHGKVWSTFGGAPHDFFGKHQIYVNHDENI